jgi:hypothetical protein
VATTKAATAVDTTIFAVVETFIFLFGQLVEGGVEVFVFNRKCGECARWIRYNGIYYYGYDNHQD